MAIDYIIDYDCLPKQTLGTNGILERIKGRERAETIIQLYREHGDDRPPSEMGFELSKNTPDGQSEPIIVVVQDLLDAAQALKPLESACIGCPANRSGEPFGCMGFVHYPLSGRGETWLLNRLPSPAEPLVWLLLKQGVENFLYDGRSAKQWRENTDAYFEDKIAAVRPLGEFQLTADQVFEMIFAVGDIGPNHGGILLLFFGAIPRDIEANDIMRIGRDGPSGRYPFLLSNDPDDDATISQLKALLHALYVAWTLNVRLLVDA